MKCRRGPIFLFWASGPLHELDSKSWNKCSSWAIVAACTAAAVTGPPVRAALSTIGRASSLATDELPSLNLCGHAVSLIVIEIDTGQARPTTNKMSKKATADRDSEAECGKGVTAVQPKA